MTVCTHEVHSPRKHLRLSKVYKGGPIDSEHRRWPVAVGTWSGEPVPGVRWIGRTEEYTRGWPFARNSSTWFIVPDEIDAEVLDSVKATKSENKHWG